MNDLDEFWVHTATVQTYTGEAATGPVYAAGVTIDCFVDDARKLVIAASGEQLASSTTIYAPLSTATLFAAGSLVTSPAFGDGRTARVVDVNALDAGSLDLPDHVEVNLL